MKNQNVSIQFQSDGAITLSGQIEDLFGDFGSMFGGDFDIEAPSEDPSWDFLPFDSSNSHSSNRPASSNNSHSSSNNAGTPSNNVGTPSSDQHNSISLALLEAAESCEPKCMWSHSSSSSLFV